MATVIGVRFRGVGKLYYFDPAGLRIKKGDREIVETARGVECGDVGIGVTEIEDGAVVKPLKAVIRLATAADTEKYLKSREKEREAYETCRKKIIERRLEMKLVDVEYAFDGQKITFYFTADGRVDFRDLVKDLAGIFRTRIELRQIGVRDESKILGGLGICGNPFCCSTFLFDFQPVSIRMAKEQGKSLNPTKISGTCGRLMCCLKYEQNVYEELIKSTPRNGAVVKTPDGEGVVTESAVLAQKIKVRIGEGADAAIRVFDVADVEQSASRQQPARSRPKGKGGRREKNTEQRG
jgi:cell fate regulator YaaT (PSP1 superfamily)